MTTTARNRPEPAPVVESSTLTVDEQAALTAGADMWNTSGVERLGVTGVGLTDGPSGARGSQFTGTTSTSFPCGTALASTWNPELIERVGRVLGEEARAKGASVLLAPTVNIHRHPLGGRNFECYSEDPHLTSEIAVAFIEGVQSQGVACAVKHFAFNDQETDRMEIDVVVDDRARREIYLPPFEAAVRRAGVWAVMAAYNRVDGQHCSQHRGLLTELLRDEWGFDGMVVSDWFGAHDVAALAAGLDLEMPGPAMVLGQHLVGALETGDVSAGEIERAAQRVLDLIDRTAASRAPGSLGDESTDGSSGAAAVARAAATEALVLLANDGVLPLDSTTGSTIAVIGWRASDPEFQGGGSAQVTPPYVITPLQGITSRAGASTVVFESGRPDPRSVPIGAQWLKAGGDDPTVRVDYFPLGDLSGPPLRTETQPDTAAVWLGDPAEGVPAGNFSVRMAAAFTPDASGPWTLSISGIGTGRLFVDGAQVADTTAAAAGAGLLGLFTTPVEFVIDLAAGSSHDVVAEIDVPAGEGPITLAGLTVEARPPSTVDAEQRAVRAAAEADVAVVVVGQDERETEGMDSVSMELPSAQVALINQVAAVNPRTVVVVNAASPITMDWADDVAAVVQMSYLGQETGAGLAAVLFGDADASGRLTTTYPERLEDAPAHANFPGRDGTVEYAESVFVGYRHYDTNDVEPRWCFGHGLSYTTFAYSELDVSAASGEGDPRVVASIDVTNTGDRRGSEVVQVYVRPVDSTVPRPDRELRAFQKVTLDPGETITVDVSLDERAFSYWNTQSHSWHATPGAYEILVGASSRAIHRRASWTVR